MIGVRPILGGAVFNVTDEQRGFPVDVIYFRISSTSRRDACIPRVTRATPVVIDAVRTRGPESSCCWVIAGSYLSQCGWKEGRAYSPLLAWVACVNRHRSGQQCLY